MSAGARKAVLAGVALLLALVLIGSQALAAAVAPNGGTADTGRVLGRTGFAYLGGLRTFTAAVLWNRIEPQLHGYYNGVPLSEQRYMVPTMRLVIALDPQFEQAYYLASYLLYRQVGAEQGIALAREAVGNNPRSGLLRSNLAQILFIADKRANKAEIMEQIEAGVSPDAVWVDDDRRFEGLATMKQTLDAYGETRMAAAVTAQLDDLRSSGAGKGDHDHDGDGQQDH